MNRHKPIIIVPRRKEYGELFDNHQIELAQSLLHKKKNITVVWDVAFLGNALVSTSWHDSEASEKEMLIANLHRYLLSLS